MSFFASPPKPASPLGYHRILSPTAAVKVSPIAFGGISVGDGSWSSIFGKSDDSDALLDEYYSLGGNFIDTASNYNGGSSEMAIGSWMKKRGVRDQMVVATKYTSGYRTHQREQYKLQSNFSGNSVKNMHVSVRESLAKLQTDYIDLLYVHWWDGTTSVEEIMRGLHSLVMSGKVLYLGVSDTPAWLVVKANEFARHNGLTPFSVYQGKWNAADRSMEGEVVPMCEDQGMAIVTWSSLGGGQILTREQREERLKDPTARSSRGLTDDIVKISDAMETVAKEKGSTLQAVALAYLFSQSTYVFPIVGVNTLAHVQAIPDALRIDLTPADIAVIHGASPYDPGFPQSFLFNYQGGQEYSLALTASENQQYQMGAWIDAPPRPQPYRVREEAKAK